MKPQLFENYKFESQVYNRSILTPIHESNMTRVSEENDSINSIDVQSRFLDRPINSIIIYPFSFNITTIGLLDVFSNSTHIGRLMPWSYVKSTGLNQIYVNDDQIEELIAQKKRVKKCGIWHTTIDNKTIIRWRHFFRPSNLSQNYLLQYEYECIIHSSGMVEFVYPSLDSLYTSNLKNLSENTLNNASIGARFRNDGVTSGVGKIQAIDLSIPTITSQDEFLGGYRAKVDSLYNTYSFHLNSLQHVNWPGKGDRDVIYRFIPPEKEIKKNLPRKLIKSISHEESIPSGEYFDDRKSLIFSGQYKVSSPTNLPFLFGQGTTFKIQDFSEESDIRLTRSIHPRDIKNFKKEELGIKPFDDSSHLELDLVGTEFHSTGSMVGEPGSGFDVGIHQKTKFVYEFPIESSRQLPGKKSSFYLYDSRTKTFHGITGTLPNVENPDELWSNMFGDAQLFSAFGTQTFSVKKEFSSSPNRLFPESWEKKDSLKEALDVAFHHDSEYHINRTSISEIDFENGDDGIHPFVFNNDFSAPFLLEKVSIEIPVEAGPGWFNDKTVAFNYGTQIDETYPKCDAGGPCITIGLMKESKNKKNLNKNFIYSTWQDPSSVQSPQFTNREIIASCALIPSGDNQKGYFYCDYDITRLTQEETVTAFNMQLIPSGFNFYSNVTKQVLNPTSENSFYTGSVRLNFTPQNSSIFYYSRFSSEKSENPSSGYDLNNRFIDLYQKNTNEIIKLENFKLPTMSGISLSDNRNVFGANPIFYDERIPVESQWNQFDKSQISSTFDAIIDSKKQNDFSPVRPPIFYDESEPLAFSEYYVANNNIHLLGGLDGDPQIFPLDPAQVGTPPVGGFPPGSWEEAGENTDNAIRYFNLGVSNAGMVGIIKNNPYMLFPGDNISVFVSKYRPALKKIKSKLGGYVEFNVPDQICEEHDVKISTGKLRVVLYGSYIKEGKSWNPESETDIKCHDAVKTYGDNPVLDQFEVYHDLELLGTYSDNHIFPITNTQFVKTSEKPNLKNYEGVGENRMRLYGSSYGKLQANFKDSVISSENS